MRTLRGLLRTLTRRPGFTAVVVLSLALGIGVNTAVFSVVDGVLLQPLPYPDADRLTLIWQTKPTEGQFRVSPSYPNFEDWRRQSKAFEAMTAIGFSSASLTGGSENAEVRLSSVSEGYFETTGVAPLRGRPFEPEAYKPNAPRRIILSEGLWRSQYGEADDIVGQEVELNSKPFVVVGVMPSRGIYPDWTDGLLPLQASDSDRSNNSFTVLGRIGAGLTAPQAEAELQTIAGRLAEQFPETNEGGGVQLQSVYNQVVGDSGRVVWLVFAAVSLVLLVACSNLANLFISRALSRRQEVAVRSALGAGRLRITALLLRDGLLFTLTGGALGCLASFWAIDLIKVVLPPWTPRADEITLSPGVLLFSLGLSVLVGVFFGLAPLVTLRGVSLQTALRDSRTTTAGKDAGRARSTLAVVSVSLAVVLVVGAALVGVSLRNLVGVDLVLDPSRVLLMGTVVPPDRFPEKQQIVDYFRTAEERLETLPHVVAAGAADNVPLGFGFRRTVDVDAQTDDGVQEKAATATLHTVTPGLFGALSIPLRMGRLLEAADGPQSPAAVVVNESLARQAFGDASPLGRTIRAAWDGRPSAALEIVGVVADVRQTGRRQAPQPAVYVAHAQFPMRYMNYAIKTRLDRPTELTKAAQAAIREQDPGRPFFSVVAFADSLEDGLALDRFLARFLGVFALVAAALGVIGVYSIIALQVAERSSEIGVRLALGAQSRQIAQMVMRRAGLLVAVGTALGLAAAAASARFLASRLYEIEPGDPWVYAAAGAAMLGAGAAACLIPAFRAAALNPLKALRYE